MAEITLKINHRGYSMCCDEGQEDRLSELAAYVDSRLRDIATAGAATNESHLLVLTSLVLADEVFDVRNELSALRKQMCGLESRSAEGQCREVPTTGLEEEAMIVEAIDYLTNKIERISNRMQIPEQSNHIKAA
ncbi:MAG: cell division protein ZapA [Alphaproteobacteria bacterium]|nr:cell division protein ZapA [Alphaproteobacteria bacterium]